MRGIIIEKDKGDVIVMTPDAEFRRVKGYQRKPIGFEIEFSARLLPLRSIAAVAAVLVAVLFLFCNYTPSIYMYVDINPSVQIDYNIFSREIRGRGINKDGDDFLRGLDISGSPFDTVIKIVNAAKAAGIDLSYNPAGPAIQITIVSNDEAKSRALQGKLQDMLAKYGMNGIISVVTATMQEVKEAASLHISPGKLQLVKKAQSLDPSKSLEELANMSVKDLYQLIVTLTDSGNPGGAPKANPVNPNPPVNPSPAPQNNDNNPQPANPPPQNPEASPSPPPSQSNAGAEHSGGQGAPKETVPAAPASPEPPPSPEPPAQPPADDSNTAPADNPPADNPPEPAPPPAPDNQTNQAPQTDISAKPDQPPPDTNQSNNNSGGGSGGDSGNNGNNGNNATKTSLTVTFDANGGTPTSIPQTVTSGNKAEKPADPTKTGYAFDGWYLNGKPYDFNSPVTGDITLTAQWIKTFLVKFDSDGGTAVPQQIVKSGEKATEPKPLPTKDNVDFAGWFLNKELYYFSLPVTMDITLVAQWSTPTSLTVTFNADGGTPTPAQQTVTSGNTAAKPDDPAKTGYTFVDWYNGATAWNFTDPVTTNLDLVAHWEDNSSSAAPKVITFDVPSNAKTINLTSKTNVTDVQIVIDGTTTITGTANGGNAWSFNVQGKVNNKSVITILADMGDGNYITLANDKGLSTFLVGDGSTITDQIGIIELS